MEYEWKTGTPSTTVFTDILQSLPVKPLQARLTFVNAEEYARTPLAAVAELQYDPEVRMFLPVSRDSTPLLEFFGEDTLVEREAAQHMFVLAGTKNVFHVHVDGQDERGSFPGFKHNELPLLLGAGYRPKAGIITFDAPFGRELIYYENGAETVLLLDLGRNAVDDAGEKLKIWFGNMQERYA
jgi:hypothetical protein